VKRSLPTLHGGRSGRRAAERPVAPRERSIPPHPLVSIGYANQPREAGQLALQLSAALVKRGVRVAALVVSPGSEPVTDPPLASFLAAGVAEAKWLHLPGKQGDGKLIADALAQLSSELVIGLGNSLAEYYQPFFSVVVTGHRRQLISDDMQVLRADLEVTTPSDQLADELAKILQARLAAQ
jgi:hypothetical protein